MFFFLRFQTSLELIGTANDGTYILTIFPLKCGHGSVVYGNRGPIRQGVAMTRCDCRHHDVVQMASVRFQVDLKGCNNRHGVALGGSSHLVSKLSP